ncbi:MAG TPA: STAS domain-containing protein, partial [Sphingomonas sp.]|nr:STAS domain-containing protein [Sphingomonas sp.]
MNDGAVEFRVSVPPSVTVRTVAEFRSDLRDACGSHSSILLDIAGLKEADLSFVQVVYAARYQMDSAGGSLRLAGPAAAGAPIASLLARAGFT